ncbi:MAG: ABC transporter permease [Acidobacteria bacterium]|nr:ABC transporter permease [Acidobacteriota bacterium]MCL5288729.1 ABC transporter permease [Acidobacteriota bacterium]
MKIQDLLELAGRNLRESKLRNSLTTLGIGVGVASLVAMLSLGVGLQELASNRLTRSGLFDQIAVYSRPEFRGFRSGEGGDRENPNRGRDLRPLDKAARLEIEKLPNVVEVYPEIRFTSEVRFGEKSQFTYVGGLTPSAKASDAFEKMQGTFFTSPNAEEVILQTRFAKTLADKPEDLLGHDVTLRYAERQALSSGASGGGSPAKKADAAGDSGGEGFSVVRRERNVRVVGIIETEPFGGMRSFGRGGIFIPLNLAEKLAPMGSSSSVRELLRTSASATTFQTLMVRMASPTHVMAAEKAIEDMGFSTFSIMEAMRNLRRFFAVLDLFLGIFGSVALAVASLGIINTLVMSVLERRREIGIMKALGASDRDVRRLFFAEAGSMGLLGGLLGVALGWVIGKAINFGTNIYLARQEFPPEKIWSVPWWLVAGAIGFAVLVSLAAGLYPASRAAKLDPVKALRYE